MPTANVMVFEAPGRPLVHRKVAVPAPRAGEILVAITACTICGSDRHSYTGRRATPLPTVLGHEILGRVAAFGPGATRVDWAGRRLEVGDRVTWTLAASCGGCFSCRRDLPQKCDSLSKYGHERFAPGDELNGGLADHVMLYPGTAVFRLPDGLDDAAACPANCATATVAAALEAAGPLAGRSALVLGAGMLGVTAVAWLVATGAGPVVACDPIAGRRVVASRFGATHVPDPEALDAVAADATGGRGFDAVIEVSGAAESVEAALRHARVGGSVVLVGSTFPTRPVSVAPETLVRQHLRLCGIHNYAPRHLGRALEFLAGQPVGRFAGLVAGWAPLSEAEAALASDPPPPFLRRGVRPGMEIGR